MTNQFLVSILDSVKRVEPDSINVDGQNLLSVLGEELKRPLTSLHQLMQAGSYRSEDVQPIIKQALTTIDNVLLYKRLQSGQTQLEFEPVHIGSTVAEVAYQVEPLMRAFRCQAEFRIQHGLGTVHMDRNVLESAFLSLWQGFLHLVEENTSVLCTVRRVKKGVRLTLTSDAVDLSEVSLAQVNTNSSQPQAGVSGPAADLITAQGMFELLGVQLTKTTGKKQSGLGVTLLLSKQLQMV